MHCVLRLLPYKVDCIYIVDPFWTWNLSSHDNLCWWVPSYIFYGLKVEIFIIHKLHRKGIPTSACRRLSALSFPIIFSDSIAWRRIQLKMIILIYPVHRVAFIDSHPFPHQCATRERPPLPPQCHGAGVPGPALWLPATRSRRLQLPHWRSRHRAQPAAGAAHRAALQLSQCQCPRRHDPGLLPPSAGRAGDTRCRNASG